jgi:hypothetical protein
MSEDVLPGQLHSEEDVETPLVAVAEKTRAQQSKRAVAFEDTTDAVSESGGDLSSGHEREKKKLQETQNGDEDVNEKDEEFVMPVIKPRNTNSKRRVTTIHPGKTHFGEESEGEGEGEGVSDAIKTLAKNHSATQKDGEPANSSARSRRGTAYPRPKTVSFDEEVTEHEIEARQKRPVVKGCCTLL